MKRTAGIALFLLLIGSIAYGETYSWVDDKGCTVFSDNPQSVPKKKRVKVRKTTDADKSPLPPPEEGVKKAAPLVVSASGAQDAVSTDKQEFGGKPLSSWKVEFDCARQEIKRLNAELEVVHGKIANPQNMTRAEYLAVNKKLRDLEGQATKVQGELMKLKKEATAAGVPVMIRGE